MSPWRNKVPIESYWLTDQQRVTRDESAHDDTITLRREGRKETYGTKYKKNV